jgi:hypothetical protein
MKADLTTVFRRWFEVAATPIDMAANAVEQYTQNHIQPVVDKAAKNLQKQTKTINAAYPGLLHSLAEDANEFKNKINKATDTTVSYSEAIKVPAFELGLPNISDYIPSSPIDAYPHPLRKLFPEKKSKKRKGGGAKKHQRKRRKKTKKKALKKKHQRRKTHHIRR